MNDIDEQLKPLPKVIHTAYKDRAGKIRRSDVYQRAIFKLIMENNTNIQDYITGVKEIEFYDHKQDKKGRLIDVKARFIPLTRTRTINLLYI